MRSGRAIGLVAAMVVLGVAGAARAQGEASGFAPVAEVGGGFGLPGQIVLSLGATADEHFFIHDSGGNWQFQIAPAADYFVAPHLSVGGVLKYDHASGGPGADEFRVAARVGYALGLNDRFSLWPMGGIAIDYFSANHTSNTSTALTLYVPVLFHVAPHFFAGVGPSLALALSNGDNEIGIDSLLGGWF